MPFFFCCALLFEFLSTLLYCSRVSFKLISNSTFTSTHQPFFRYFKIYCLLFHCFANSFYFSIFLSANSFYFFFFSADCFYIYFSLGFKICYLCHYFTKTFSVTT